MTFLLQRSFSRLKKSYFYLYILFSLGEGLFENFPKNITRYKGRGNIKVMFSLSD